MPHPNTVWRMVPGLMAGFGHWHGKSMMPVEFRPRSREEATGGEMPENFKPQHRLADRARKDDIARAASTTFRNLIAFFS